MGLIGEILAAAAAADILKKIARRVCGVLVPEAANKWPEAPQPTTTMEETFNLIKKGTHKLLQNFDHFKRPFQFHDL